MILKQDDFGVEVLNLQIAHIIDADLTAIALLLRVDADFNLDLIRKRIPITFDCRINLTIIPDDDSTMKSNLKWNFKEMIKENNVSRGLVKNKNLLQKS